MSGGESVREGDQEVRILTFPTENDVRRAINDLRFASVKYQWPRLSDYADMLALLGEAIYLPDIQGGSVDYLADRVSAYRSRVER